jgi:hypothetical protein
LQYTFKADLVCQVEDDQDTVCFFEIIFGEAEKLLLACCVPNADCDFLVVDFDNFFFKGESEGGGVELCEGI